MSSFSVHVHICDAAYISSITSNSFLNLDSWAWFHFWGHLHFWGLLPPFCHFHFLVCPPLLVCLHLLSLLFLGCFYFLGCLIKSPIFAVQKAIAPKNGVEFRQGSICAIRSSLPTSCDVWRRCRCHRYHVRFFLKTDHPTFPVLYASLLRRSIKMNMHIIGWISKYVCRKWWWINY